VKIIAQNRKAFYNYHIEDKFEAGLVLTGTEIKSIREGKVSLQDAYVWPENGEMWLVNSYIAPYQKGSFSNHEPNRPRKLLLHRKEIASLIGEVKRKGFTLVPLRLYLKKNLAKVEVGLGRGKRAYDKRETTAKRDAQRRIDRALRKSV
jgi:SsrA-binding protein